MKGTLFYVIKTFNAVGLKVTNVMPVKYVIFGALIKKTTTLTTSSSVPAIELTLFLSTCISFSNSFFSDSNLSIVSLQTLESNEKVSLNKNEQDNTKY